MRTFIVVCLAMCTLVADVRAEEWEPAKTEAVIVGVLQWQHNLTAYDKHHRKDQELRDVLLNRGVPAANIQLLLDEKATLGNIKAAIAKAVSDAPKGSTLIVYYAGHGWATGNDYCFANYDVDTDNDKSAWHVRTLGKTLADDFKGSRVFLWADCCFSGGLEVVVDQLAAKHIAAFELTSAGTANTSTNNWTFTQAIIDGLRGDPLVDLNGDGRITLAELHGQVDGAMKSLEGQAHGFKAVGLADDFVISKARGRRPVATRAKFAIGSYVVAQGQCGRVVDIEDDQYWVQFYHYADKVRQAFPLNELTASAREVELPLARDESDCKVEWQGDWFDAKVVKKDKGRWLIHYTDYDDSWNEWVGSERIKLEK